MVTNPLIRAVPAARKALNFAAPALVMCLLLVSRSYGLVAYPSGQAGVLERSIDAILAKEQVDILRETALVKTQNAIVGVINVLNVKLSRTSDPSQRALIEQQISTKQTQYQGFQSAIDVNGQVLLKNLTVLNPAKDNAMRTLGRLPSPRNQIQMFLQASVRREQSYVVLMRRFLQSHPATAIAPF